MKKKWLGIVGIILVLIVGGYLIINRNIYNFEDCENKCSEEGFEFAYCLPSSSEDFTLTFKKFGKCKIEDDWHCKTGECNCYCFHENIAPEGDEQLVNNCGDVAVENVQECCDEWAEKTGFIKEECASQLGQWTISKEECFWECAI